MPKAAGITISQLEHLLECVTRATKEEKQGAFARHGIKVLRGTHARMARSLIKRTATHEAAVAAAMEVWWEYANDKARDALRSASVEGKGPPQARRPPSTNAFFKANGEVTPVGEFAFEWMSVHRDQGLHGDPSSPLIRPRAGLEPRHRQTVPKLQGGTEHQQLQQELMDIGELQGLWALTNRSIGPSGFKPDVLWYRMNPDADARPVPCAVFEIELGGGGALAKSLMSLERCHTQWNAEVFLFVPRDRLAVVRARLEGAHHDIQVFAIEDCSHHPAELAQQLGFHPRRAPHPQLEPQ